MSCPVCGSGETRVATTYTSQDGDVVRFRVCNECGEKFRTLQPPEDLLSDSIVVRYYPRFTEKHRKKKVMLEVRSDFPLECKKSNPVMGLSEACDG